MATRQDIGGAQAVDALFPARAIWASPVRFRSAPYRRALQEFNRTPGKLHTVSRGDRLGAWTILHPEAGDRFPQADDNALVLIGELPGVRVLLLSALGRPGQNALLERRHDLRADIVVTGLPVATEAIGEDLARGGPTARHHRGRLRIPRFRARQPEASRSAWRKERSRSSIRARTGP